MSKIKIMMESSSSSQSEIMESSLSREMKVGPGGWPNEGDSEVGVWSMNKIIISYGGDETSDLINSLQFGHGYNKLSPVYGNQPHHSGFNFKTFEFRDQISEPDKYFWTEGDPEYITKITGAAIRLDNRDNRVTCLTFETNVSKYGPFGSVPKGAKEFSFQFDEKSNFVGLFGTFSKAGLSSIGAYIQRF